MGIEEKKKKFGTVGNVKTSTSFACHHLFVCLENVTDWDWGEIVGMRAADIERFGQKK